MELSPGEWIYIIGMWLMAIICGAIAMKAMASQASDREKQDDTQDD